MIFRLLAVAALASAIATPALSQKKYDPGASDSEIKLGQTLPYSGPASVLSGVNGKSQIAWLSGTSINDPGRHQRPQDDAVISSTTATAPPKTVELTRQLVEQDKVLCDRQHRWARAHQPRHPQISSTRRRCRSSSIADRRLEVEQSQGLPVDHVVTIARLPDRRQRSTPSTSWPACQDARIGVLMSERRLRQGLLGTASRQGLGEEAGRSSPSTSPTRSPIPRSNRRSSSCKRRPAPTSSSYIATGKHATQAIRKVRELGWKPQIYLPVGSASSVPAVLKPAGAEAATGVITAANAKSPGDPSWDNDPGMKGYYAWAKELAPELNPNDSLVASG